jgi:glycerol-3-phosphate O-acyltransferase
MKFDDIRPYRDEEVKDKIKNLTTEEQFQQMIGFIRPDVAFEEIKKLMDSISTIYDFQSKFIVPILDVLINKTTRGVTFHGLDNLEKGKSYLFVSTHRDIVLDSALMNYVLLKQGFATAEIAIGDNLMKIPWIVDLVKLNKTFIVKRSVPKEQKLDASMELSSYINHTIKEKRESIWIAQRSGRSKDGDDRTNPSLLKMFTLGGSMSNVIDNLKDLEIVPFSVTYEFNPCDALTMPELLNKAKGETYEKQPMEDMIHMGKGLEGEKGRVEVSFSPPLNNTIDSFRDIKNRNDLFAAIANEIDRSIHRNYKLMPTNYIAFDLLNGNSDNAKSYSSQELENFKNYIDAQLDGVEGDEELKRETFLKIYANPLINYLAAKER